jgi:hypothetical protein
MNKLCTAAYAKITDTNWRLPSKSRRILEKSGLSKALDEYAPKYVPFINAQSHISSERCGKCIIINALKYCTMEMPSITEPLYPLMNQAMKRVRGSEARREDTIVRMMATYLAKIYRSNE